jgi:hypothetical protein
MPVLHLALQDGFADDAVVVRVGNGEPVRHEHVTTKSQIGLARAFEVSVPDGPAEVEVLLPERGLSARTRVDSTETPFLGVSLRDGAIAFRPASERFRYL